MEMPIDLHPPDVTEAPTWIPRGSAPTLALGDLHLWRVPIGEADPDEGSVVESLLPLLAEDQRSRARGMTSRAARGRYIRAQAGLRRILGLYLGSPPATLLFRYGPVGKPFLAEASRGFEFNLTTADDLALVGVSLGSPLGVDCERIRPRRGLPGIARRMFGPGRAAAISTLPEPEALTAFYRAWTALEADAKADGRGLFRPRPPDCPPLEVRHCIPAPGYIAAVARSQVPPLDRLRTFELEPLPARQGRP